MKPYSPLRGVLPLWMPIRERDRANADNNVLLVHRIISGRERGKKEKKRGERKELDKIFESESFDSPDADLRDTGSRLLSLFQRLRGCGYVINNVHREILR